MKISPTSLTVSQLLGSAHEHYVIPSYQRRYSWREKQLKDLIDDISNLDGNDTHLLGSIVCLTGQYSAGLNRLELVDGQQRLTTLTILLHCMVERLQELGLKDEAQDVARLLKSKSFDGDARRKIQLDSLDHLEFEKLHRGESTPNPSNPQLHRAFSFFREWLASTERSSIQKFLYRLINHCLVIRLDVGDAKDAFKLFETINNRGLRLSPTDIIKNFLLGNAARIDARIISNAKEKWAEIIALLDGLNTEQFFRQFLYSKYKRRITLSQVIVYFKQLFMQSVVEAQSLPEQCKYADEDDTDDDSEELDGDTTEVNEGEVELPGSAQGRISFEEFLLDVIQHARVFRQIVMCETKHAQIDRHLRNLKMIKSQPSYGFLMYLRVGGCKEADFVRVLRLTESFLMRRHICRMRTSENENTFARLCNSDCLNVIPHVIEAYAALTPSDEKFTEDFQTTRFVPSIIDRARYCLEQIELRQHGHFGELIVAGPDEVHVEHIMPQKIKTKYAKETFGDWPNYLGANWQVLHEKYVACIGNLTLFSGVLNISVSNNPYVRKKQAYVESAIQLTKSLPIEYPEFRIEEVKQRAAGFAKLAAEIWPLPQ